MSKRRYKFVVTDIEALAKAYPAAVEDIHIPARIERKPKYSVVAKLLDCELAVPGIEVVTDSGAPEQNACGED